MHLGECEVLEDEPREHREQSELDNRIHKAKNEDVVEVSEEVLSLHVVTRGEHQRRQTEIKEEVLIEGEHLCEFNMLEVIG